MRLESFSPAEIADIKAHLPEAQQALVNNVRNIPQYDKPVLLVGDQYPGIWLEHNQDTIFLADYAPEHAWSSIQIFMDFQRPDGLIPFCFPLHPRGGFFDSDAPCWQLQCVYAFTQCALDVANKTHRPIEDYRRIYAAGAAYDNWIAQHRDRARTGLVEMYCEYDTGHDNDPRVTDGGIPHSCPGNDAVNMPDLPCMPIQNVDLSAMIYGNRMALATIADKLGLPEEAAQWHQKARDIQAKINELLYDPVDNFFYDRSPQGLRKYKTEHITRLFLNKVLTQDQFDSIYNQYFTVPGTGFCSEYPIPAVAIDDPHFVKACPMNCWGANSQANTAERTLLWMDYYKRPDELTALLSIWLKAVVRNGYAFIQELNPFTGSVIAAKGNYSPTLIIFIEAIKRLNL